ncbi:MULTISPECIES: ATP-binding protein [unclassified Aeromonas]|uniref:ATP-binding protein n=1 Tax=unclassified Aeromonas TaxID=257493 RepID=UPI003529BB01
MINAFEIDNNQAENIINIEEGYLTDVKAKEIKPAKLSETVSAFANSGGGDIYLGIEEDSRTGLRRWNGYADQEAANDVIHVLFNAHPFGNHLTFEFLSCENKTGYVLHIIVKKIKHIVKSTKGEIFVRQNAGKIKIEKDDDIAKLKFDKGIFTFEDEWIDVNHKKLKESKSITNFMINIIPHSEPIKYLENQELIRDEQAKVVGVLLFCDEPAIYLAKRCSIKIMRYKTREEDIGREFLDGVPLTVEGDAYNLIYQAVDKTKKIIENIKRLGDKSLISITYPHETIHEIITNAVLHRDYSIAADVQIRIFDNRVEIESPGKLPGHVTTKNILDTQSARNPTLVRLINKFPEPPNKDVGEGLNTAFRAMNLLRLKAPEIVETDDSVLVFIYHQSLASPEELVIDYLREHEEITNKIGREITGIKSENKMKSVFLRLKDRDIIEQIPERKGSAAAWRKTSGVLWDELKVIDGKIVNIEKVIQSVVPKNINTLSSLGTEYIPLIFMALVIQAVKGIPTSTGADMTSSINKYLTPPNKPKFSNNVSRALRDARLLNQPWLSSKVINVKTNKRTFSLNDNWEDAWESMFSQKMSPSLGVFINQVRSRCQLDIDI